MREQTQPPKLTSADVTSVLASASKGSRSAVEQLLPLVYGELRALAGHAFRGERREHTLQPTALVHEVYVKLVGGAEVDWENRRHFFAIAANAMRQVLTDHARRHRAAKRGGEFERVTLGDRSVLGVESELDLLALDEALTKLTALNERHARIVELRFFSGMSIEDAAAILEVSRRTVELDWRMARAWLQRELSDEAAT